MLSLFRHATRRSVAAARPALVAHYSAEHSPELDNVEGMEELHEVLEQQAEEKGSEDPPSDRPSQDAVKWRAFGHSRIVKPYDFTYKARLNAERPYQTRRATQGPPASIARHDDVFHQLDIDPLDLSMEPSILSHYVSEMGKIYGRNITGLTSKSQRRMGKAIRRAKMMGVIPFLRKSPYYFSFKSRKESQ